MFSHVCLICEFALAVLQFSSIVGAITPTNLVLMWPLMVLSVLHVLLGVVPGRAQLPAQPPSAAA
jgi:hypothetical protein